ncbi:MAG TPA: FG-GAP-like repeat-containing protein [Opitutaceae bacterium]|nr:FG-GAP-like repeat-containing protein [Opitutaceae bacterium]
MVSIANTGRFKHSRALQNVLRVASLTAILLTCSVAAAADSTDGLASHPLSARSGPRGQTLFALLAPDQTGVRTVNRYADPRMWGDRYLEANVGSIGSGVAIGDYDGDGRPDIFVAGKSDGCRLFRNLGDWKFEDVTEKSGVAEKAEEAVVWKGGVVFADVNNDGWLDLYICRFDAPNLLYINQGDGTFKEMANAYGLDVKDACVMATFFDYDRDGWLDVFIQTNLLDIARHPTGQRNFLFHNTGHGRFTNVTERAGIIGEAQGHSATCWDYDDDGWPDLYIANDFGVPDKLYHNNRDGTFSDTIAGVVPHTTFASMGSDFGDVNNDGLMDFFVADMAATTHEKDQRTASNIRAGGLGHSDALLKVPKYLHNALYLNTGTGRCREAAFLAGIAATDWTWAVRWEDLDDDGWLDLFVTNGMNREQSNVDLIAREMKAESAAGRTQIMYRSPVMNERNLAFRNLGDLEFKNVSAEWGLDLNGVSFGAAFGDLDGDGDLDLVVVNYQANSTVYRNDSDSGHRVIFDLRGTVSNRFGVSAKVRIETDSGIQIRQLESARGYMSSSEPMVHFGLGKDTIIKQVTVTWPSGLLQTFRNVDADRRYTLTESSSRSPQSAEVGQATFTMFDEASEAVGLAFRSREETVDETSVQRLLSRRLNPRGPALAVGDVDGDGLDDVALGGTTLDRLQILHGSHDGHFTRDEFQSFIASPGVDDGPLLLFDAAGRGYNDLLVTKGGNSLPAGSAEYQPQLYFNDGRGHFRPAPENSLPSLSISVGAAAASDFDRDGRLDLFLGARLIPGQYPLSPHSVLLQNRGGRFVDITNQFAPQLAEVGMVTSALWSDADADGWPDLLLTSEWGQVKCFHNQQGKSFEDWTEKLGFAAAGTGWWTSLAAADFNGDGRIDYAVGNVGLNTQYRATHAHPALLYSGDFKGDETTQLIEAYYEGDQLYAWRTRRDLGAAIPGILRRYTKNDLFARATLPEIVGADRLAAAQRFAATELRSGVFLSQPDGTYRFEPLPRIAQIAPLQGIVAGDYNGDGFPDIYTVQNSYAPIQPVGRFDGGLSQLMLGDGQGHFTPVSPAQSNLLVPGDAKALVALDLNDDGWPDFFVSRNNDSTLAFLNKGGRSGSAAAPEGGRHFLRVELHEAAGNAAAVGSRVTVKLTDGKMQTSEVYAGSGYYSQSTAACYFGWTDLNRPKRINIHWPSGIRTTAELPSDSTHLVYSAPSGGIP